MPFLTWSEVYVATKTNNNGCLWLWNCVKPNSHTHTHTHKRWWIFTACTHECTWRKVFGISNSKEYRAKYLRHKFATFDSKQSPSTTHGNWKEAFFFNLQLMITFKFRKSFFVETSTEHAGVRSSAFIPWFHPKSTEPNRNLKINFNSNSSSWKSWVVFWHFMKMFV